MVCRNCGQIVVPASPATLSQAIEAWPDGTRYEIALSARRPRPTPIGPRWLRSLREEGFTRLRVDGQTVALDEPDLALPDDGADRGDRRSAGPRQGSARAAADSIETAFAKGLGRCRIIAGDESQTYVRGWRCSRCGTDHLEPQPNLFRYNSPLGACPVCEGFGRTMELDLGRIVPDPSRTIREGAIAPWSTPAIGAFSRSCWTLPPPARHSGRRPVPAPDRRAGRAAGRGRAGERFTGLKGFFQGLERRSYKLHVRVFLSRWRRYQTLSRLPRRPAAARGAGRQDRRPRHRRALGHDDPRRRASFIRRPGQTLAASRSRGRILAQIESRLDYLGRDRARLPDARPPGAEPLGRRAPARQLDQDRWARAWSTRSTCSTSPRSASIRTTSAG